MKNIKITKEIFSKKTRDYTFIILFLVVFSIFIMAAIKPSLTTAFSLKKEEADLKQVDALYENKISDITLVQSQIEDNRDSLYLLDEAISENPQVNKMVEDVKNAADKDSFLIKKASIADVNLLQNKNELQKVSLLVEGTTDFPNLMVFINDLFSQRRLKTINQVTIAQDIGATGEAQLKVTLTIDGYFL